MFSRNLQRVTQHSADVQPTGHAANVKIWTLVFEDTFSGTSLDTSKWNNMDGNSMNNVTTVASNISVTGGNLLLTLSDSTHGAEIATNPQGWQTNQYMLQVGHYTEARIYFPGDGSNLYNWPAWWVSGPNWPAAGEHDIAEVLEGGKLTVNYHWGADYTVHQNLRGYTASGASWGNSWHVYGLYRKPTSADVYYDGVKVASYATDDNGNPQSLILNIGSSGNPMYGMAGALRVDYVRAWA